MKNRINYRYLLYLAIFGGIIMAFFVPQYIDRPELCQINSEDSKNTSVQLNTSVYDEVFGSQSCSPHTLTLMLPSNSNTNNSSASNKNRPNISTLVTFTNQEKKFYIRRIDRLKNGIFYTNKDSCLSWKWAKKSSSIQLSMERNLEIQGPNIQSIIFIISLPIEIIESNSNIVIRPYTWNRFGEIYKNNLSRNYPLLKNILRKKDKRDPNENRIKDGQEVSKELAQELSKIENNQGIYIDHIFWEKIQEKGLEKYQENPDRSDCAISQYLE